MGSRIKKNKEKLNEIKKQYSFNLKHNNSGIRSFFLVSTWAFPTLSISREINVKIVKIKSCGSLSDRKIKYSNNYKTSCVNDSFGNL